MPKVIKRKDLQNIFFLLLSKTSLKLTTLQKFWFVPLNILPIGGLTFS